MNLVEKLLKADAKKAEELKEKTLKSKRLAEILGTEEAVEFTIREIPTKRMNDLLATQFNGKGHFDVKRSFDAKALTCCEGIIELSLRDKSLQEHFGAASPKDLAVKLFGNEVSKISDEIAILSGIGDEDEMEEEIKN